MDVLAEKLGAYSSGIAKFAGTVTCLHFLSGALLLNDIRRLRCSDTYQIDPFLGGIVQTLLGLKLGTILRDEAMIHVNAIGLLLNFLYTIIFYYYSSTNCQRKLWSKIAIAVIFNVVCLTYVYFEDAKKIEFRLSMIITALLIALVGMPLLNLGEIIRTKSTEGLPFPLIMGGSVVSASWTVYGIAIGNSLLAYQNLLLLILSCIQLSLFIIYPNKNRQPIDQSLCHISSRRQLIGQNSHEKSN